MPQSKFFIRIITLVILGFALLPGCENKIENTIPSVPVNLKINVYTDPEFMHLREQGNAMIITNTMRGLSSLGYDNSGIIIYNNGGDEFYAFDRTCPHDFPKTVRVELEGETLAVCPECGSTFVLPSIGAPTLDGPATLPLREYRTSFNPNTGDLNVYN